MARQELVTRHGFNDIKERDRVVADKHQEIVKQTHAYNDTQRVLRIAAKITARDRSRRISQDVLYTGLQEMDFHGSLQHPEQWGEDGERVVSLYAGLTSKLAEVSRPERISKPTQIVDIIRTTRLLGKLPPNEKRDVLKRLGRDGDSHGDPGKNIATSTRLSAFDTALTMGLNTGVGAVAGARLHLSGNGVVDGGMILGTEALSLGLLVILAKQNKKLIDEKGTCQNAGVTILHYLGIDRPVLGTMAVQVAIDSARTVLLLFNVGRAAYLAGTAVNALNSLGLFAFNKMWLNKKEDKKANSN